MQRNSIGLYCYFVSAILLACTACIAHDSSDPRILRHFIIHCLMCRLLVRPNSGAQCHRRFVVSVASCAGKRHTQSGTDEPLVHQLCDTTPH